MPSNTVKVMMVLEGAAGGSGRHVLDLIRGLNKSRYEVTLAYSRERADSLFLEGLSLLKLQGVRVVESSMQRGWSHPCRDLQALKRLVCVIRRLKPHLLHLHGAKAGTLGRLAALITGLERVVYTSHGGSYHKFNGWMGYVYLAVEKLLAIKDLHIIGVSKSSCKVALDRGLASPDRIHLVYNGIGLEEVLSAGDLSLHNGASQTLRENLLVLYPASFLETKGHLQLLSGIARSLRGLPVGTVVLLAGEGPLEAKVRKCISRLGLNSHFRFLGFCKDLTPYFEECHLVLLPSQSEAFPYVLLEAMKHGKPILATAVGGIPEMVRHGYNGWLVPADDFEPLLEYLHQADRQRDLLQVMGSNGRKRLSEEFGLDRMIQGTEAVYASSLCQRQERRCCRRPFD